MFAFARSLACFACFAAGTAWASPDAENPAQQILDAEAAELAAWEAHDIEAIMNAYAPDAIVMPGGAVIENREALRALFVDFLKDPGFTLRFRSDPPLLADSAEIGVTVGTYVVTFTGPDNGAVVSRRGHHLMTWRRQGDGQWRIVRQMTVHDRAQ